VKPRPPTPRSQTRTSEDVRGRTVARSTPFPKHVLKDVEADAGASVLDVSVDVTGDVTDDAAT